MKTNYPLIRARQNISIQKEMNWITAILPKQNVVQEVSGYDPILKVKPVFNDIFKLQVKVEDCENVMQHLRENFSAESIVHHTYSPLEDENTRYYLTEKIVLVLKKEVRNSDIEKIMEKHALKYIRGYQNMPFTHLFGVTKTSNKNPLKVAKDLMENPLVITAEANLINRFSSFYTPKDNYFDKQWHLESWKGIELEKDADVRATKAWDLTKGDRKVVLAILDDGFDLTHPDFQGLGKIVFPKDYVDGDVSPFPSSDKGDFHGTPVAGVAIAEENGNGIVGIAPKCAFMPVRFDLKADDNLLWEMFDYVGKRADVISNSWGPVPVYAPLSDLLDRKFTQLTESGGPNGKGCVILFAAGNYNAPVYQTGNADFKWKHPSRGIVKTNGSILNGNAAHKNVIAVSASTSQNRKAMYSNWGKEISVCAPSDNFNPFDPQGWTPGRGIFTSDNFKHGLGYTGNSRYTNQFGGTSSATPLVAGIAALIRSTNPGLTAIQIRQVLEESCDKIVDENTDPFLGYRKGNYDGNGHSEWFGYGKVNAERAVKLALEMSTNVGINGNDDNNSSETKSEDWRGISIIAALVNPIGSDAGGEIVTLFNEQPFVVDLKGWSLVDGFGRTQMLDGISLKSGKGQPILMTKLRLSNKGGVIVLINPKEQEMQRVEYSMEEAQKLGWHLKF